LPLPCYFLIFDDNKAPKKPEITDKGMSRIIIASGEKSANTVRSPTEIEDNIRAETVPNITLFDFAVLPDTIPEINPEITEIINQKYISFSVGISFFVRRTANMITSINRAARPDNTENVNA